MIVDLLRPVRDVRLPHEHSARVLDLRQHAYSLHALRLRLERRFQIQVRAIWLGAQVVVGTLRKVVKHAVERSRLRHQHSLWAPHIARLHSRNLRLQRIHVITKANAVLWEKHLARVSGLYAGAQQRARYGLPIVLIGSLLDNERAVFRFIVHVYSQDSRHAGCARLPPGKPPRPPSSQSDIPVSTSVIPPTPEFWGDTHSSPVPSITMKWQWNVSRKPAQFGVGDAQLC